MWEQEEDILSVWQREEELEAQADRDYEIKDRFQDEDN